MIGTLIKTEKTEGLHILVVTVFNTVRYISGKFFSKLVNFFENQETNNFGKNHPEIYLKIISDAR